MYLSKWLSVTWCCVFNPTAYGKHSPVWKRYRFIKSRFCLPRWLRVKAISLLCFQRVTQWSRLPCAHTKAWPGACVLAISSCQCWPLPSLMDQDALLPTAEGQQKTSVQFKLHFSAVLRTSMGCGWAEGFAHWKHLNLSLETILLANKLFSFKLSQTKEHRHIIPLVNPASSCKIAAPLLGSY